MHRQLRPSSTRPGPAHGMADIRGPPVQSRVATWPDSAFHTVESMITDWNQIMNVELSEALQSMWAVALI